MIFAFVWFLSGLTGTLIARFCLFKEPMRLWEYLLFTLTGIPQLICALIFLFLDAFPSFVAFFNRKF